MSLPQHVVSCRGSQLKRVFSGFQAGMPQETAPHAPQDKRASALCKQASLLHSQASREPELPNSIPSSEQSNPSISRPFRRLVTYCF